MTYSIIYTIYIVRPNDLYFSIIYLLIMYTTNACGMRQNRKSIISIAAMQDNTSISNSQRRVLFYNGVIIIITTLYQYLLGFQFVFSSNQDLSNLIGPYHIVLFPLESYAMSSSHQCSKKKVTTTIDSFLGYKCSKY